MAKAQKSSEASFRKRGFIRTLRPVIWHGSSGGVKVRGRRAAPRNRESDGDCPPAPALHHLWVRVCAFFLKSGVFCFHTSTRGHPSCRPGSACLSVSRPTAGRQAQLPTRSLWPAPDAVPWGGTRGSEDTGACLPERLELPFNAHPPGPHPTPPLWQNSFLPHRLLCNNYATCYIRSLSTATLLVVGCVTKDFSKCHFKWLQ